MVVDDAVVARGQMRHWISAEPSLDLVASLRSGREAVDQLLDSAPDVVVLDIEMPDLDGIATLPKLLAKDPDLAVIIASTLTRRNAEISMKALALGALDCISKPDAAFPESLADFRRDLIAKIRELGLQRKRKLGRWRERMPLARRNVVPLPAARLQTGSGGEAGTPRFALRPFAPAVPRVVVIGSSTGGPQALTALTSGLAALGQTAPVLITQHMPPTFTTILAEHLARATGRPTVEAQDGELVLAGRTYLAPGGRHMRVARRGGNAIITLDDGPAEHHCRPAVDPLFASAAETWGSWVLGIILTGMGCDGTRGAEQIVAAGGSVIAQDEATSVVWGMPGSAAEAGLCSAVLPLNEIAPKVLQLMSGGARE